MPFKKLTKENAVHYVSIYAALLFCVFSLVFFSMKKDDGKAFMALVSILYVFVPAIAQKMFKFHIQNSLYVCIMFYTVCPLLGYSYNLYYLLPWWDDILHAFAGVIFAMFGAYLPKVMCKDHEPSVSLCVFCAFFFSVAISGLWELAEFTMDTLFGTDMQKDTAILTMRPSYLISELLGGNVGELIDLRNPAIVVNGEMVNYYVDVGLIDTMKDVFIETLGAGVYVIVYRIGGGKHFAFDRMSERELAAYDLIEEVSVATTEEGPSEKDEPLPKN